MVEKTVRILVVDDEPATAHLLKELAKHLEHQYEFFSVGDGVQALEFLHACGPYANARRPDLILLDMNMPRLDGLATLSAIKSNPHLCVIPVIMLSSASAPELIRKSYQAHANSYVIKPADLDGTRKFLRAVEAFWLDLAARPSDANPPLEKPQALDSKADYRPLDTGALSREDRSGHAIASSKGEEASGRVRTVPASRWRCQEHDLLMEGFGAAVRELLDLHEQQFRAIVDGDTECSRFDSLIHMANERKQQAKYELIRHIEAHGC